MQEQDQTIDSPNVTIVEQWPTELLDTISDSRHLTLDYETTSLEWYSPNERGIYCAISVHQKVWVFDLRRKEALQAFNKVLNEVLTWDIDIIGHNIKFDMHWAGVRSGSNVKARFIDTQVGAFLLNENRQNGLKPLIRNIFGVDLRKFKDVLGKKQIEVPDKRTKKGTRKKTVPKKLEDVPLEEISQYVAEDAFWTEKLYFEYVKPNLQAIPNLWKNFNNIQIPLTYTLWRMEERGVEVDVTAAKRLRNSYRREAHGLETNLINNLHEFGVGDKINFGSPQQLDSLLYDKMGLPRPPFRGKRKDINGQVIHSKYQTDELCLLWLAAEADSAIAKDILKLRKLKKVDSTFLAAILDKSVGGRLHTTYRQTGAKTGRLSSAEPNLQNMPRDKNIRSLFVAKPGHKLITADLSQAELRLMAHYTKDPVLIEAYTKEGIDLHADTGKEVGLINMLGYEKGRFAGKTANFSAGYGVWVETFRYKLYKDTEGGINLTKEQSKLVLDRLNNDRFKGVSRGKERLLQQARKGDKVFTLERRERRLPGLSDYDWGRKSYAERQAFNAIFQGSVGDVINRMMISTDICKDLQILQVHDEIVLEVPDELIDEVSNWCDTIASDMTQYYGLTVPLILEYNIGEVWNK